MVTVSPSMYSPLPVPFSTITLKVSGGPLHPEHPESCDNGIVSINAKKHPLMNDFRNIF